MLSICCIGHTPNPCIVSADGSVQVLQMQLQPEPRAVESDHKSLFRSHRNRGSTVSNNALIIAIRGAYITNHIHNKYGCELL